MITALLAYHPLRGGSGQPGHVVCAGQDSSGQLRTGPRTDQDRPRTDPGQLRTAQDTPRTGPRTGPGQGQNTK
jgi:hypothetical protein